MLRTYALIAAWFVTVATALWNVLPSTRSVEAEAELLRSRAITPTLEAASVGERIRMAPKQAKVSHTDPFAGCSNASRPRTSVSPPEIVAKLDQENDVARAASLRALSEFGPRIRHLIPRLVVALEDGYYSVEQRSPGELLRRPRRRASRTAAAKALGATRSEAAVPPLVRALAVFDPISVGCGHTTMGTRSSIYISLFRDRSDSGVPLAAARALAEIGQAAVPALIRRVTVGRIREANYAVLALGAIGKPARAAAGVLSQALQRTGVIRGLAVWALGRIGPSARGVVPLLFHCVRDDDRRLASLVWTASLRIAPHAAARHARFLGRSLTVRTSPEPRTLALFAELPDSLMRFAQPMIPALAEHQDRRVRSLVDSMLGMQGR